MQLVSNPHQFDVMLATNLYGSIIVNLLCGLTKGQGLISGQDFSDEVNLFDLRWCDNEESSYKYYDIGYTLLPSIA